MVLAFAVLLEVPGLLGLLPVPKNELIMLPYRPIYSCAAARLPPFAVAFVFITAIAYELAALSTAPVMAAVALLACCAEAAWPPANRFVRADNGPCDEAL